MFTLDHLGIVVRSLEDAVPIFCTLTGVCPEDVEFHEVESEGVRIAMLKGNIVIELLEPTRGGTGIANFLEKRGGGFHHWCFEAHAGASARLAELKSQGMQVLTDEPWQGAEGLVFFVHPKSAGGILTEFVEKSPERD